MLEKQGSVRTLNDKNGPQQEALYSDKSLMHGHKIACCADQVHCQDAISEFILYRVKSWSVFTGQIRSRSGLCGLKWSNREGKCEGYYRQGLPVFVVSSELTLNPYGFTNSDLSVPVIPKSYHDSDTSNLTGLEGNVEPNAFAAQAVIRRMIYHHHYLKTPNWR